MASQPPKNKSVRKQLLAEEAGYPSLREVLSTRRRFLEIAGTALAAGSLMAACQRALGSHDAGLGDRDEPLRDRWLSDGTAPMPDMGVEPVFTLRVPTTGTITAHLLDAGMAQFYVQVVTYNAQSFQALEQATSDATQVCVEIMSGYTYEVLSTSQGVLSAEQDLYTALDELVMTLNEHTDSTLLSVSLHIDYLDPDTGMGGVPPSPYYPDDGS